MTTELFMNVMLCFRPVFRSYKPADDSLKETILPTPEPIEGEFKVLLCSLVAINRTVFSAESKEVALFTARRAWGQRFFVHFQYGQHTVHPLVAILI